MEEEGVEFVRRVLFHPGLCGGLAGGIILYRTATMPLARRWLAGADLLLGLLGVPLAFWTGFFGLQSLPVFIPIGMDASPVLLVGSLTDVAILTILGAQLRRDRPWLGTPLLFLPITVPLLLWLGVESTLFFGGTLPGYPG